MSDLNKKQVTCINSASIEKELPVRKSKEFFFDEVVLFVAKLLGTVHRLIFWVQNTKC